MEKITNKLYIPIDIYQEKTEFLNIIKINKNTDKYSIRKNDYYTHLDVLNKGLPEFGWKIHISATPSNSSEILRIVSEYCMKNLIDFKFIRDNYLLSVINSKQWGRTSSGKFIVIYPSNEKEFTATIQDLNCLLLNFKGPYILSDKRFNDNKVLFYRYGRINSKTQNYAITGPNGEEFIDNPTPYYKKPSWILDPIQEEIQIDDNDSLLNNRYEITEALHITNSGGIYKAIDTIKNQTVVIKEARPHTMELIEEVDAVSLRKIEKEILIELTNLGVDFVPKYIDSFHEWEHYFVVLEYIEGVPLSGVISSPEKIDIIKNQDRISIDKWFQEVYLNFSEMLDVLHDNGISHGDITPENIILNENNKFYLVDFELAITNKTKNIATKYLVTEGFRISKVKEDFTNRFRLDREAFGLTLLRLFCTGTNQVFLDRHIPLKFLKELLNDKIITREQFDVINNLIYGTKNYFINNEINLTSKVEIKLENTLENACNFLVANYNKDSQPLFNTVSLKNQFSFLYGDLGILKTLIASDLQKSHLDIIRNKYLEILDKKAAQENFDFNISYGYSLLGELEHAYNIYKKTNIFNLNNLSFHSSIDLSIENGISGKGLLLIELFNSKKEELYYSEIITIANFIIDITDKNGIDWVLSNKLDGNIGFFNGILGIPFFLIETYKVTKNNLYLHIAEEYITYVTKSLIYKKTGVYLEYKKDSKTFSPYLNGSMGLVKVLNKYNEVYPAYDSLIEEILGTINFKYCQNATYLGGMAGMGDVLLDIQSNKQSKIKVSHNLKSINDGINLYSYTKENISLFSGNNIQEIKLNFGEGISGVIHYLVRYLKSKE